MFTIDIMVQPDMLIEPCDLYMSQGVGLHGVPILIVCTINIIVQPDT